MSLVSSIWLLLRAVLLPRAAIAAENLALRQQLGVLRRSAKRPRLRQRDRVFWVWLSRLWADWQSSLVIVKPETVIRWHRKGFRLYWGWKSRKQKPSRPNHVPDIVAVDFFVVATVSCRLLYRFLVLRHDRRRVVHFNVTAHPTARWTAQQVVEAFPYDEAPRFLIRDHDGIYGQDFRDRIKHFGIEEVIIAYRSPWQSPYVERLIGSIRRECLDRVIVLNEARRHRSLRAYFAYYHEARTHLSLDRNAPIPRMVEPPSRGRVIAIPQVGGLHHRYTRAA